MINLYSNKPIEFRIGKVLHLKVIGLTPTVLGTYVLTVEEITSYTCHICGIVKPVKPDGSLPDGWSRKKYSEGSCFICDKSDCQEEPICRVCGCTNDRCCRSLSNMVPCHWVESDLCSACVEKSEG